MEDFSELIPRRFADIMQALPLPDYAQRSGAYNLASRLPEFFAWDLGPGTTDVHFVRLGASTAHRHDKPASGRQRRRQHGRLRRHTVGR